MSRGHVGIKRLERITRELGEVIRVLNMKTADFDGPQSEPITLKAGGKTKFIRETTRLWRQSWALDPLKRIRKELQKFL